jgi:ribose transport system substrate-binding protein
MCNALGGKGSVYVSNVNPGISTTDQREEGFKAGIAEICPDVTVLETQYNEDDSATAAAQFQAMLAANPNLSGVFGANLFSALGAANGVEAAGKGGEVTVIAFDAPQSIVDQIASGLVDMTIAQHPFEIGYYGVITAFAHISGHPVPPHIGTGYTLMTKDNIEDPNVVKFIYSE